MKRKLIKLFLAAILILGLFGSTKVSADEVEEINSIQQPVDITGVLYYRDGGTIGVVMSDAAGKELKFCPDRRRGKKKPYPVFWGATHPTIKGAKKIAIAGHEERVILKNLQQWVRDHLSNEELDSLLKVKSTRGFSTEQFKRYQVIKLIVILKKRQEEVAAAQ